MNMDLNSSCDNIIVKAKPEVLASNRLSLTLRRGKELRAKKQTNAKSPLRVISSSRKIQSPCKSRRSSDCSSNMAGTGTSPIRRKILKRCPLRIAELAEPSKRRCLHTWRSKHGQLPAFMLDKLKQKVLNQKIVADISDARNCYKVIKPRDSKKSRSHEKSSLKKEMEDIRIMSAIFTHRVATQLIKPMNMPMPDKLKKISNIVAREIQELIQNRKTCADYVYDTDILEEMAAKITYWISSVLIDAEFKLIDDELRAKKVKEKKNDIDGNLTTLIDQYSLRRRRKKKPRQDLEEEEGPVLDAIDNFMDKVMHICLPKDKQSSSDDGRVDSTILSNDFDNEDSTKPDRSGYHQPNGSRPETYNSEGLHVVKVAHEFENSANQGTRIEKKLNEENKREADLFTISHDTTRMKDSSEQLRDEDSPIETYLSDNFPDAKAYNLPELSTQDSDDESKYDSTEDSKNSAGDEIINIIVDTIAGEEIQNVSDGNVSLEEPLDERKKVKFLSVVDAGKGTDADGAGESREPGATGTGTGSAGAGAGAVKTGTGSPGTGTGSPGTGTGALKTGTGSPGTGTGAFKTGTGSAGTGTGVIEPKRVKSIRVQDKQPGGGASSSRLQLISFTSDIIFQPPNSSLLSVVDEPWPDDFTVPTLRPSASVSKSITSLGEIQELDEPDYDRTEKHNYNSYQYSTCASSNNVQPSTTSSFKRQQNIFDINVYKSKKIRKQEIESSTSDSLVRLSPSKLISSIAHAIEAEQLNEIKLRSKNSNVKNNKRFKNAGKGDHIESSSEYRNQDDTDTNTNVIVEAIKQRLQKVKKSKLDYRVHRETAPAWAITSTSESLTPVVRKKKLKRPKERLRKWLKDLDLALINMGHWYDWISFTSNRMLYLKQEIVTNRILGWSNRKWELREWSTFKNVVDKDAMSWRKLNRRTLKVLKTYVPDAAVHSPKSESTSSKDVPVVAPSEVKKVNLSSVMLNIEGLSSWLHRLFVSTEHSIKCNCRGAKTARHIHIPKYSPIN